MQLLQEMTKQINEKNETAVVGKAFAEGKRPSMVRLAKLIPCC